MSLEQTPTMDLVNTIENCEAELSKRLKNVNTTFFAQKDVEEDNDNWHESYGVIITDRHGEPQNYKVKALKNGKVICMNYPDADNTEEMGFDILGAEGIKTLSVMTDGL